MWLTDLADVAKGAGLKVVEVDGWKSRGNHGEGMIAVKTITCHHTANGGAKGVAPSLNVVKNGRPGLSGPLAHFVLGTDGTVYVVAAGHCNHAGVSKRTAETNSYAIGIEAEAAGDGRSSDWPAAQMDAYARLAAALVHHYKLSVDDVLGHKETCSPTGRKSDPSFSMPHFRGLVVNAMKAKPAAKPASTTDPKPVVDEGDPDDMAVPVKLGKASAAALNTLTGHSYKEGDTVSSDLFRVWGSIPEMRLAQSGAATVQALTDNTAVLQQLVTAMAAQTQAIQALAERGITVDGAAVAAAIGRATPGQ